MKRIICIALLAVFMAGQVFAGTVVVSTLTYSGTTDTDAAQAAALPQAGVYAFTLNVVPVPSTRTVTVVSYLQQQGVSGALYTIPNSTFTTLTCSNSCNASVFTDTYQGGNIVPRFTISGSSAIITWTARLVTP